MVTVTLLLCLCERYWSHEEVYPELHPALFVRSGSDRTTTSEYVPVNGQNQAPTRTCEQLLTISLSKELRHTSVSNCVADFVLRVAG